MMLITICPADDHPADHIVAAADDPAEQVRITPGDLPDLVLALPEITMSGDEEDDLRVFRFEFTAKELLDRQLFAQYGIIATTIDYRDWHRLYMGDRPAAEPWQTVHEECCETCNQQPNQT